MVLSPHRLLSTELLSGLGVLTLSLGFGFGAMHYDIGMPARMQAGFFPLTLGVLGSLIGIALIAKGLVLPGGRADPPALRPLLIISAAFVAFGLTIEPLGLLPAVVICGSISAKATPKTTWIEALLLSAGLAFGIWLLFVVLLSMPIPALAGV